MSKNQNLSFQIHYSSKYKLFDLVINKNNKFYQHYHLETIKEINSKIEYLLKILQKDHLEYLNDYH